MLLAAMAGEMAMMDFQKAFWTATAFTPPDQQRVVIGPGNKNLWAVDDRVKLEDLFTVADQLRCPG